MEKKNREHADSVTDQTRPRAFTAQLEKNIGYFLVASLLSELNVKETIDILASQKRFRFDLYDMIAQLIYARILYPCSKSKTASTVFPRLYHGVPISEDQVYDGCAFIGESYKKYIELFNHCYEDHYKRDFSSTFFDCTNYYFEIDLPKEDKQKGPSKENRHEPIIGQALLLDADLVPLAMQMYPGNESEKPYIRKIIQEMKERYKVDGKTVQVADKGLNCARNIYAAVVEAKDGYIFSKSVHGKGLSEKEKQWLLLENDTNVYTDYRDKNGKLLFRLKSCVDTFSYKFKETDPETGEEKETSFCVKEKRIVSYNPSLAQKQKAEIMKMVDKAANYTTYKKLAREDLGELLATLLVSMGLGLMIADIMLPVVYQLGPERARPWMYVIIFAPIVVLLGGAKLGLFDGIDLSWLDQLPELAVLGVFALVPLVPLVGMLLSCWISCRIYARKEF